MRVMNEKEVKAVNGGSDNGIAYEAGYAVGQVVDAMVNTAKEAWSGFKVLPILDIHSSN